MGLPDNGRLFSTTKKWAMEPWKDMKEPKRILLSKRGQYEKATNSRIPTIWDSGKGKTMMTVKVVARG